MIEAVLASWLSDLPSPLYPVVIPDEKKAPGIVYKIESEFTPQDNSGPYGAIGHRVRIVVWDESYKTASEIITNVRAALNIKREGFLVSVEDRGDYQDSDTNLYGIVIDVEITELQTVIEFEQTGLRGAAKALLLNNTDCAANVFASRIAFANCNQFPCMGIRIDGIEIQNDNDDDLHTAEIEITVKLPSSADSENQIEAIVGQVRSVLSGDIKLIPDSLFNINRIDTEYSSVGRLCFDERRIEFTVKYYDCLPDSQGLSDFNTANADWNIDDDQESEAKDTLALP